MNGLKTNNSQGGQNSGKLIYVVDDEPMLLELATVILEPEGYQIQTFRDPEVALDSFNQAARRPDLLITDYAMHTMTGLQLIGQLRRIEPGLKILLVSGTVGEDVFQDALERPDRFLAKPYQAEELTTLARLLLNDK